MANFRKIETGSPLGVVYVNVETITWIDDGDGEFAVIHFVGSNSILVEGKAAAIIQKLEDEPMLP